MSPDKSDNHWVRRYKHKTHLHTTSQNPTWSSRFWTSRLLKPQDFTSGYPGDKEKCKRYKLRLLGAFLLRRDVHDSNRSCISKTTDVIWCGHVALLQAQPIYKTSLKLSSFRYSLHAATQSRPGLKGYRQTCFNKTPILFNHYIYTPLYT